MALAYPTGTGSNSARGAGGFGGRETFGRGSNLYRFPGERARPPLPNPIPPSMPNTLRRLGRGLLPGLAADALQWAWRWYSWTELGPHPNLAGYSKIYFGCDDPDVTTTVYGWALNPYTCVSASFIDPVRLSMEEFLSAWSNPVGPPYIYVYRRLPWAYDAGAVQLRYTRNTPTTPTPTEVLPDLIEIPLPLPMAPGVPQSPGAPGAPVIVPPEIPHYDPVAVPPGSPMPLPWQPPVRGPRPRPDRRPDRSPTEQPQQGPEPSPRPAPVPALEITPERMRLIRSQHRSAPPPPGVREPQKIIGQLAPGLLKKLVNGATEAADAIDCVFKALPRSAQGGAWLPHHKLRAIWDNYDKIDTGKAIMECLENEVEDRIFGRIGRASASANRRLGINGPGVGASRLRGPGIETV